MDLILLIGLSVFTLGFIIGFHELGHFLAARLQGLYVPKFSVGFGPRLVGFRWGDTDFRISAIPFGGYVSIPQFDSTGPAELRKATYREKLVISLAGPAFNLLLAFILSFALWGMGRDELVSTSVSEVVETITDENGAEVPGPAFVAGFLVGDKLLEVDGKSVDDWMAFRQAIVTGVRRDEQGRAYSDIVMLRNGQEIERRVHPVLVGSEGIRSVGLKPEYVFERVHQNPYQQFVEMADMTVATVYALFHWDSDVKARNMAGPVGVVHAFTVIGQASFVNMLWFAIFVNINLAMINLMPIPVLDGGHIVMLTLEKVFGREIPTKIRTSISVAFALLLLGYITYVSFFDIGRVIQSAS